MKRIIKTALVIIIAVSFIGEAALAKEYKIGCVDPVKILNEYKKTKEAEGQFETKRKAKEADRKKLVDEITKLKDEQAFLSDKAKAEKQNVINNKIKNLQAFDKKMRDELMGEGSDMLGLIQKDIEKVIADYAKEVSYDMVVNSRVLLFYKEELDFTGEIIKRLNK